MGKIHDAYGWMDVEVTKSVTLSVECHQGASQRGGCKSSRISCIRLEKDGPGHAVCYASQKSWYSPTPTDLQERFDSSKWLGGEKLTKPRFYRHLKSIGWTLVERADHYDWVWLCPACSKAGGVA